MFELSIRVKNDERSFTHKHLIYDENIVLSHNDKTLNELANDAKKSFMSNGNDKIDSVDFSIKMNWE